MLISSSAPSDNSRICSISGGLGTMDPPLHDRSGIGLDQANWESISHRLFTLHALPQVIEDPNDTDFVFHFKCHYAQTLFENELMNLSWTDLKAVLAMTSKFTLSRSLEENILQGVVHNIFPGLESVEIHHMKEDRRNDDLVVYAVDNASRSTLLQCRRNSRYHFTTHSPLDISLQVYYQASRNTPLIDGFIVHQNGRSVTLYILQIMVSQHKTSGDPSGAALVRKIYDTVKSDARFKKCRIHTSFVMIQPCFISACNMDVRWELPILPLVYDLYRCTLSLPTSPPGVVVTVGSLASAGQVFLICFYDSALSSVLNRPPSEISSDARPPSNVPPSKKKRRTKANRMGK